MHRKFESMEAARANQRCDIGRIPRKKAESQIYMTLHGASGTDDRDLAEAIAAGITVVHINTEVRLSWRRGLDSALSAQPNEIVPYKILPQVVDAVKSLIAGRLALFSAGGRQLERFASP